MNIRALIAEFIGGTFALIFVGAGSAAAGKGGIIGEALAHGLIIIAFIYAYGPISGTHINPAVTIAMWFAKQLDTQMAGLYIVSQFIGGICAALLLRIVVGGERISRSATTLADGVGIDQGLIIEILLTFFLVTVIFNTAVSGKAGNAAPIAIGIAVTAMIFLGNPLTGAALNPVRTLGPAIASGIFSNLWLYMIAPPFGAVMAALLYTNIFAVDQENINLFSV